MTARATALSRRQREVMILRARGFTFKEIADQMCLSEGTVKVHISNAYGRLGVMNLAEAFIALGWLVIPEEVAA